MSIRRGHARVLFNEGAFAEDTMQSGRAGAEVLRKVRGQFEQAGVEIKTLRDSEGLALRYLAFGVRHHPRDSNAQTVYEIAHRRLRRGGAEH